MVEEDMACKSVKACFSGISCVCSPKEKKRQKTTVEDILESITRDDTDEAVRRSQEEALRQVRVVQSDQVPVYFQSKTKGVAKAKDAKDESGDPRLSGIGVTSRTIQAAST